MRSAIRMVSGAITLLAILLLQGARIQSLRSSGWLATLLFTYAVTFSFAYRGISTGAGALVLFASAQLLMIGYGYYKGERTSILGVLLALGGMIAFLMPSASAPPLSAAVLMMVAGLAWGGFSLLGRSSGSPISNTASSFLWAVPLSVGLMLVQGENLISDGIGTIYALLSGILASAIGYAIWYWVRIRMTAISAGSVQLSVPILSAALGVVILDESISWKCALSALATLSGVAWITLTSGKIRREKSV